MLNKLETALMQWRGSQIMILSLDLIANYKILVDHAKWWMLHAITIYE